MEMEEHISNTSDTSGDESDNGPDKFADNNAGVGRSYECTFCKRGFTNAQALGGHMNIHRKDKLKAKQTCNQQGSSLLRKSKNTHNDHEVYSQISSQQQQQNFCHSSSRANVNYHQFYFPSSNPSYQQVFDHHAYYYRNFALHGGFVDANLSLRIGSPDGEERKEDMEANEIDLELRLGPNSTFR